MHRLMRYTGIVWFLALAVARGEEVPRDKFIGTNIPQESLKNANAVVRYENATFRVKSAKSATFKYVRVVTVLNAQGRVFGEVSLYYDKFKTIDDFDITLYDAGGNELRSLKNKEIADYPATSGFSLYDDNRMKHAALFHDTYPYTIEIRYEFSYKGYLNWPGWYPEEWNASVEQTTFRVELPDNEKLRYWQNVNVEPIVAREGSMSSYVWEMQSLPAFEPEPVGPSTSDQLQCVQIAPGEFEIDGYRGNLASWKSFGDWFYKLYSVQQTLPEQAQKEVLSLTNGITDPKEKIRTLYDVLQKKTRYVSVQLGIGGWKPFPAEYVYERGYGDCKALTNYMLTMLKSVNITAYPALIYSGRSAQRVIKEFSSNVFNHVILCVPLAKDTVWLECTSQSYPFGHIGTDNESRYTLVVGPKGGDLVRTPSSAPQDNIQTRTALVRVAGTGNTTAQIQTYFSGNQQDYVRDNLKDATPKEKEEWLQEHLEIPAFTVREANFLLPSGQQKAAMMSLDLLLPQFASGAGTRLLFQPNLMEKRTYVPPVTEKRKQPVVLAYPYLDIDSITYTFPEGFVVEAMPKPVRFETPFAKYQSAVSTNENGKCLYTRRLEVLTTEIPAERYVEYRKFFQDVVQADKAMAAIVRK